MGDLFTTLFEKVTAVVQWFADLFIAIFVAVWDLVKDFFCWCLDEVLKIAVSAINTLDVSGITVGLSAFGSIPADVLAVMGALRVGEALAIIAAALTIRFGLQLIPFVRLGS
jgi:hypothetical protein